MRASIRDLQCRTTDVLTAVERGETVAVFPRGKEKARIVPAHRSRVRVHEAFGMWKDRKDLGKVPKVVRTLRRSRFDDF